MSRNKLQIVDTEIKSKQGKLNRRSVVNTAIFVNQPDNVVFYYYY